LFYDKLQSKITNKIKAITFGINNWDLVKADEKKKEKEKKMKKLLLKKKAKKNKQITINNRNIKNNINNEKEEKKVETILLNPIDYYFFTEILNKKDNPPKKKSRAKKLKVHNKNPIDIVNIENDKNTDRSMIDKKMNEQDIIKKSKEIMEYTDEEKNNLKYELALK